MLQVLARRVIAVMAADAVAHYGRMVDGCRQPAGCRVTVVAAIAGRYVRRVLAGGSNAIVAGIAGADHLRVIDCEYRCEHIGRVAVLADV